MPDDVFYSANRGKYSHPKAIKRRKVVQTPVIEKDVSKSEELDSDVALSPENEQKKELCSYLQLMKPTDKKTVMILQNRRSTRVKNLSLMQEKRELEKKLREEHSEDTTDNNSLSKVPSLQSIADVNDELEKQPVTEYFHFPRPRDDLKDTVTDFEDAIEEDWFKDWKEQANKKLIAAQSLNGVPDKKVENDVSTTINLNKRTCVMNQENVSSENKAKSIKNNGNQKKKVQSKGKDSYKAENGVQTKQDKNGYKEASSQDSCNSLKTSSSESDHFILPKPPLHLMTGVCDFADAIKDNVDLIKDKSDCMMPLTSENKSSKTAIKELKKTSSETSTVENNKDLSKDNNSSKISNSIKTKGKLKKKKKKSKKLLLLCRSSSFKIKLVTKKKNSVSPNKSSKSSNRKTSNLPSRNDNFSSPAQSSKVITEENQTKKENLKETPPLSPKKRKSVTESLPKSPLKDTNENPLESDGDKKIVDTFPPITESPKRSDLPPLTRNSPKKNLFTPPKKEELENGEDSHPSTIMAIFKYDSNLTTNLLKPDENDGFYSQILNIEKGSEEDMVMMNGEIIDNRAQSPTERLTSSTGLTKTCTTPNSSRDELPQSPNFISFKKDTSIKPLHRCLKSSKQKGLPANPETANSPTNWASGSPSQKQKKDEHSIHISMEDGAVLKIFYMEFNLVLCQEMVVSFWTQTALGNVLGE